MKLFVPASGWLFSSLVTTPPAAIDFATTTPTTTTTSLLNPVVSTTQRTTAFLTTTSSFSSSSSSSSSALSNGISNWISLQQSPSKQDIALLRSAFAEFYGLNRNLDTSLDLLNQVIDIWTAKQQPDDELAGLIRVRGDCYMLLGNAEKAAADYNQAITLLTSKQGQENADPSEYPTALLGRARAKKALATSAGTDNNAKEVLAQQSASDYQEYLKLTSREDWDTEEELILDGALRNPYAAWEWGTVLRMVNPNDWSGAAAQAHSLAAQSFDEIGDKARAVISALDAGIDLATTTSNDNQNVQQQQQESAAQAALKKAIAQTKGVSSRDIPLLQRVIAKEGEGRMAYAALLWSSSERPAAEQVLGDACLRLDQLQQSVDAAKAKQEKQEQKTGVTAVPVVDNRRVLYSIDDETLGVGLTCSKFKNKAFLTDTLKWPESLQQKVTKLEKLET